jgi:hypothetical protein
MSRNILRNEKKTVPRLEEKSMCCNSMALVELNQVIDNRHGKSPQYNKLFMNSCALLASNLCGGNFLCNDHYFLKHMETWL